MSRVIRIAPVGLRGLFRGWGATLTLPGIARLGILGDVESYFEQLRNL